MESSNIENDFVVLTPSKQANSITNTHDMYERLNTEYSDFKGHELISCYSFSENWSTWEIHPHGDEIVMLLSGSATFILDVDGEKQHVHLSRAGEYAIIPRNTWHTAHVVDMARVLFITPGEGTRHKPDESM